MTDLPKSGDHYCCPRCGFKLSVTADCNCDNMHAVELKCCNAALEKDAKAGGVTHAAAHGTAHTATHELPEVKKAHETHGKAK